MHGGIRYLGSNVKDYDSYVNFYIAAKSEREPPILTP